MGLLCDPRAARSVGLSEPILPRVDHEPGGESRETGSVVPEGPALERPIRRWPARVGVVGTAGGQHPGNPAPLSFACK